ncbi:unnamed protein product [Rotaria sordida]|uniref:Uncharacterized protein n=1 Tax=Rotaria sordida TaxID=392033 RepID=A0A815T6E0_9BILA|nr:unnamed protein product [Rotaria sordida]CAF1502289.1 unnamed protein product [Rotaria sordida]CAF4197021.1 unnamed protein product [Rotaria sordida]
MMTSTDKEEDIEDTEGIEILVPYARVNVSFLEACISDDTIKTDSLGPCHFFLTDFMKNGEPNWYLCYYTFAFDEAKLPVDKVLVEYLNLIWESIIKGIENNSMSKESLSTTSLSQFRLVVGGGDVAEGNKSRLASNLLNHNEIDLTNKLSNN